MPFGSIISGIGNAIGGAIPGIIVDKWLGGPSPWEQRRPAPPALPAPTGTAVVPTSQGYGRLPFLDGGSIPGSGGTQVPVSSVGQMVGGGLVGGILDGLETASLSRIPMPPRIPPGVVVGTGGRIRAILQKARAHTGMPMTTRKIVGLIKEFGPYVAGGLLGLAVEELAEIWSHGTRRRRRRWTKRDMARARAYISHLQRQEKQLNELRPRRRATRRTVTSTRGVTQIKN